MNAQELGLSPYSELVTIVESLPLLVRETRRARRQSMREAARQTGLSGSTFCRLESGEHGIDLAGLVALLRWMDRPCPEDVAS